MRRAAAEQAWERSMPAADCMRPNHIAYEWNAQQQRLSRHCVAMVVLLLLRSHLLLLLLRVQHTIPQQVALCSTAAASHDAAHTTAGSMSENCRAGCCCCACCCGGACCWLHAALTCCGPCDSHLPPPHPAPLWRSPHRGCSHSQPCCCSAWLLGGGTQPLSAPGRAVCTLCAPLGRLARLQTDQIGQMRTRSRQGPPRTVLLQG